MHGIKIIWKILTFNYRNGSWLTAIIFYLSKKPDRICRKHWSPNRYEIELHLPLFPSNLHSSQDELARAS